jgi:hypothetical protein
MSRKVPIGVGFSNAIARFAAATGRNIEEIHKATSLRLFRAVILSSPVLTGRLRANWLTSVTDAATGTVEGNGFDSLVLLGKVIDEHKPGEALVLANNLPYAARIEYDGWSHTKAPRGMVRINVTRFTKLLRDETRRVTKKR